jgi:hypothetical protein
MHWRDRRQCRRRCRPLRRPAERAHVPALALCSPIQLVVPVAPLRCERIRCAKVTFMRRILTALIAAGSIGVAAITTSSSAQAWWGWGPAVAGGEQASLRTGENYLLLSGFL